MRVPYTRARYRNTTTLSLATYIASYYYHYHYYWADRKLIGPGGDQTLIT